jgi:hypothetical protein
VKIFLFIVPSPERWRARASTQTGIFGLNEFENGHIHGLENVDTREARKIHICTIVTSSES